MGLLQQKIAEVKRQPTGRPDTLKNIFDELPEEEQQELLELLNSDIQATTIAIAIKRSGLSESATSKSLGSITVAIRRFRQGETKFAADAAKQVAS